MFSENKFPLSVFENHNVSLLFNEKAAGFRCGLKARRPLETSEGNLALPAGPATNGILARASEKSGLGEGGGGVGMGEGGGGDSDLGFSLLSIRTSN